MSSRGCLLYALIETYNHCRNPFTHRVPGVNTQGIQLFSIHSAIYLAIYIAEFARDIHYLAGHGWHPGVALRRHIQASNEKHTMYLSWSSTTVSAHELRVHDPFVNRFKYTTPARSSFAFLPIRCSRLHWAPSQV